MKDDLNQQILDTSYGNQQERYDLLIRLGDELVALKAEVAGIKAVLLGKPGHE